MTARFVLNELDLDLSALTATFLIIVVIIISTSHGGSGSLGATSIGAVTSEVVARGGLVETGGRIEISHGEFG